MADENTTGSEVTTETTTPAAAPASPAPASSTETDDAPSPTLLTAKPEGEEQPAAEPKAEEVEQTDEEKAAAEAKAKLFGAPEGDYEIAGLPEGMEIDKEALDAVTPVAKELGLSNEGFSKIAQVYAEKVLPSVSQRVVDGIQQDVVATHARWATEATEMVQNDTETFGGKKLAEVQALSAKAIDRFGGEEFRAYLEDTGLGNHPAMIKFAFQAGSAIAEDTTFERGGTPPRQKTSVEKFYGDGS